MKKLLLLLTLFTLICCCIYSEDIKFEGEIDIQKTDNNAVETVAEISGEYLFNKNSKIIIDLEVDEKNVSGKNIYYKLVRNSYFGMKTGIFKSDITLEQQKKKKDSFFANDTAVKEITESTGYSKRSFGIQVFGNDFDFLGSQYSYFFTIQETHDNLFLHFDYGITNHFNGENSFLGYSGSAIFVADGTAIDEEYKPAYCNNLFLSDDSGIINYGIETSFSTVLRNSISLVANPVAWGDTSTWYWLNEIYAGIDLYRITPLPLVTTFKYAVIFIDIEKPEVNLNFFTLSNKVILNKYAAFFYDFSYLNENSNKTYITENDDFFFTIRMLFKS